MIKLNREQAISVGGVAALLVVLVLLAVACLQMRSEAAQELGEREEMLGHLEERAKSVSDARARKGSIAPVSAYIDAPTQGLAGSALQAYLLQRADADHALLVSAGIQPAKREDPPDSIRLQANLDMNLQTLQTLLYQLESGTPYVFVESLVVQLVGAKSDHAEDPQLHISLGLRALWRQKKT
jgi:general secretion pathway protein M